MLVVSRELDTIEDFLAAFIKALDPVHDARLHCAFTEKAQTGELKECTKVDSLELDSLEQVFIFTHTEEVFGITFPDDLTESFGENPSLGDLYEQTKKLVAMK